MGWFKTILLWMTGLILVRWVWLFFKFLFVGATRLVSELNRILQEQTALNRRLEETIAQPIKEAVQRKWAAQKEEWRAEAERDEAAIGGSVMTNDQRDELQQLRAEIAALRTASGGAGTLLPSAALQSLLAIGVVLCIAGLAYLILANSDTEDWEGLFFMLTCFALVFACFPFGLYLQGVSEMQSRRQVEWEYDNYEALEANRVLRQREAETEAYETEAAMLNASARHAQAHARMAELEAERANREPDKTEAVIVASAIVPPTEPLTRRAICTVCNHIRYASEPGHPGSSIGWGSTCRRRHCDGHYVYDG